MSEEPENLELKGQFKTKEKSWPVWHGRSFALQNLYREIRDNVIFYFTCENLLVLRARRDRNMDHKVFLVDNKLEQILNWDGETYDIEQDKIYTDRSFKIMFVLQGCRVPIDLFAWKSACDVAITKTRDSMTDEEKIKFGVPTISSREAFTKMNHRNAELIAVTADLKFLKYTYYLVMGAVGIGVISFAAIMGWIPSTELELLIQMKEFLLQKLG